jgi:integrase
MNNLLASTNNAIAARPGILSEFGQAANRAAESLIFKLYQDRRPINTQRTQRAALSVFTQFLQTCGLMATGELYEEPTAWAGITWGLAQAFQKWLLLQGYSVKTINDRVSVVKVYMTMANQAGIIPDGEILRLQSLKAYTHKEAIDTDAKRAKEGIATRTGNKKIAPTAITEEQARELCQARSETPQARRDALMMCLLLDHGMRVSEVADLRIENIDRTTKQITFYRRKTGKTSCHNLRGRVWRVLTEYLRKDNHAKSGALILRSCKTGKLIQNKGITTRAIGERVALLGQGIGLQNLSPHDCRHYGATIAGNDPQVSLAGLMAWGGWSSAGVAIKYMNRGEAENDGVSLGMD